MLLARSPGAATLRARALAICAVVSLALAACGGQGGEPLLLRPAVPLTDTKGAEDSYGVRSRLGAQLAVGEIDEAGGIGRRKLALRVVNDEGEPESAIAAADSLVGDPRVLAHVGQDGGPPAFEGVAGTVAFDSNGDPVNKRFTLGVIQGGRIVLPEGAR